MDGLFAFLRAKCRPENIIGSFHALVHADDTLIMSTNRDGFIHKCNQMMIYFEDNQLKLNLSKSSFSASVNLIEGGKIADINFSQLQ